MTSLQQEQSKDAAFSAVQEIVHGSNIQDNVQSTAEDEMQESTAAPKDPLLKDEGETQSDNDANIRSMVCCQPRTKELIALEGIKVILTQQMQ